MTVHTDDPIRHQLLRRRFEERQRLAEFKRRLGGIDPGQHPRAFEAIEHAIRASADELAAIEGELAGATITPTTTTTEEDEARAAMRQRLRHLELVLLRVPDRCRAAAAHLRRAIRRELRAIEQSEGRPPCRPRSRRHPPILPTQGA